MKPLGRPLLLPALLLAALLATAGSDQSSDREVAHQELGGGAEDTSYYQLSNVTVPVCCGADMVFNITHMGCEPAPQKPLIAFHYENGQPVEYNFAYNVQVGFPNCSFYSLQPETEPDDTFFLLPDGQLKVQASEGTLSQEEFCLLATPEGEMEAILCFPAVSESSFDRVVYQTLYPVGLIISAVFLASTLFVYCLVVELRDLLGRCLMCSVLALGIAQVSTVIVQIGTKMLSATACVLVGIMMHFWYLAAFLWLNVICFNVFLTIWRKNDLAPGRGCSRWFLVYSCYAWGLSLLVCCLAVARDFAEGMVDSFLPKPSFGQSRCWFSDDDALIIFFYGPTSVVLGINVLLFCASAYKLCSLSKNSEARIFQFSLYLKLFVLMGVTWIFEVISFFVQHKTNNSSGNYVWLVFDLINIMQGIIIFIVFVCRRAVLIRVCEVLCGVTYTKQKFPAHYQNVEADLANNETTMKHSVI